MRAYMHSCVQNVMPVSDVKIDMDSSMDFPGISVNIFGRKNTVKTMK
jgi:hypothetical protein